MYFRVLIICTFGVAWAMIVENLEIVPGSRYPPTKGEVWPKPQFQRKFDSYLVYKPSQFQFEITSNTCDILQKAVERYSFTLRTYQTIAEWSKRLKSRKSDITNLLNSTGHGLGDVIKKMDIVLSSPCEQLPYFGMDESYQLTINNQSYLRADSIWGILRGLESFSHSFYLSDDYTEVRLNKTVIFDYPRYQHRGLMLDTARHYVSLNNILKTLNAMSMNKMNVFHWHIVDDESFPYQSEKFPDLSSKGAYHQTMIYTKADIANVIKHATYRGIRVVPEFDAPGHTRSWGEAFPDVLTQCYQSNKMTGLGPMDPTNNNTYALLRDLISEVQEWFPDKYFHVGGDEVDLSCWSSNPVLDKYMKENNVTVKQLHAIFMKKVLPLLKPNSEAIVWQEVFDEGVPLNQDVLVQVWKSSPRDEMVRVLNSGHKVLFSSAWYLDQLKSGGDWHDFYIADPRDMMQTVVDDSLLPNIVGGEACMWGEVMDDANVISRVWPRASAVAERLWSASAKATEMSRRAVVADATHRLEEHTCRMNRRGVAAQPPNGPGMCLTHHF